MELEAFDVAGFRSLADAGEVPVRSPTVLTGANDGGKTASLDALGYLLGDYRLTEHDFTIIRGTMVDGVPAVERVDRVAVTGKFTLTDFDRERFGLTDSSIKLRRSRTGDGGDVYELHATVPADERLRGLRDASRDELRDRAEALGIEADGDQRRRDAWIGPLEAAAAAAPTTEAWVPAPRDLIDAVPRYLRFSSTREPDLRVEIQQALRGAYERLLDDETIVGQVRDAERELQGRLQEEAEDLCAHIRARCPELVDIRVDPTVSFREGFGQVAIHAGTHVGLEVPVDYSGAGRRRRMTLAVWEWTRDVLNEEVHEGDDAGMKRGLVIAYDEPDTHLDYQHQRELVELIRSQGEKPGVKILIATHSLNLIDKVEIADVVHLQLEDRATKVSRLLTDEHDEVDRHLANISAAMGLRNSVLLHERLFVAVEGVTEAQALPILFRTATGLSLQAAGIALISGNSNQGALHVARWLSDHDRQVHFVIDRDSTTQPSSRKVFTPAKLAAVGIEDAQMHLVGDPDELEDLFSDDQWSAVANEAWPRVDGEEWTPQHFVDLRTGGKFSADLLELVKTGSEHGPGAKSEVMVALASCLDSPADIPPALREIFNKLVDLASHAPALNAV